MKQVSHLMAVALSVFMITIIMLSAYFSYKDEEYVDVAVALFTGFMVFDWAVGHAKMYLNAPP